MTVFHDELHGTGMRYHLFYLRQIDQEGTMAAHNHWHILQVVLHLLGGGTQHVGAHLTIAQVAHLDIVAHGLDIKQVREMEGDGIVGGAREG